MNGTVHAGLRICNDRNGTGRDCRGNEVLSVDNTSPERAKDIAGRNLAMINGKARNRSYVIAAKKRAKPHQCSSLPFQSSGIMSARSTSRLVSGNTPSIGPVRAITFATTGAAV